MLRPDGAEERDCHVSLFDDLYRQHHRALHAYLLGRCGSTDIAADLLQETAMRLWQNIRQVQQVPPERRGFWLFAVARNVANDYHRRRATRERRETDADLAACPSPTDDPQSASARSEAAAALHTAIQRLPPDLRTAISLRYLAEMNSREITEALGIPAGTVRYRVWQARKLLARDLGLVQNAGEVKENTTS